MTTAPLHLPLAAAGMCLILAGGASAAAFASRFDTTPQHTSKLTGQEWMDELLQGHEGRFYNEMGMHKHVFHKLLKTLVRLAALWDTKHVSTEEQLGIFLHYTRRASSNRALQERFQRSADTISIIIHRILNALTSKDMYNTYVKLPSRHTPLADEIRSSKNFYPFFKDCLGALDGTHIAVSTPELVRGSYRNRKGQLSQNVLAVSSMDMRFLYILPGWEGSASDSRVYEDARSSDFHIPDGKYYLADAGYAGCSALLVPYRGIPYHLKEWGRMNERPKNYQELFNLRHAQARNVIERIFGVCKKRFRVLVVAQEYKMETQAQLVSALGVVHNFIRIHNPDDKPGDEDNGDEQQGDEDMEVGSLQRNVTAVERGKAAERRDRIAKAMWSDYERRGRRRC